MGRSERECSNSSIKHRSGLKVYAGGWLEVCSKTNSRCKSSGERLSCSDCGGLGYLGALVCDYRVHPRCCGINCLDSHLPAYVNCDVGKVGVAGDGYLYYRRWVHITLIIKGKGTHGEFFVICATLGMLRVLELGVPKGPVVMRRWYKVWVECWLMPTACLAMLWRTLLACVFCLCSRLGRMWMLVFPRFYGWM